MNKYRSDIIHERTPGFGVTLAVKGVSQDYTSYCQDMGAYTKRYAIGSLTTMHKDGPLFVISPNATNITPLLNPRYLLGIAFFARHVEVSTPNVSKLLDEAFLDKFWATINGSGNDCYFFYREKNGIGRLTVAYQGIGRQMSPPEDEDMFAEAFLPLSEVTEHVRAFAQYAANMNFQERQGISNPCERRFTLRAWLYDAAREAMTAAYATIARTGSPPNTIDNWEALRSSVLEGRWA